MNYFEIYLNITDNLNKKAVNQSWFYSFVSNRDRYGTKLQSYFYLLDLYFNQKVPIEHLKIDQYFPKNSLFSKSIKKKLYKNKDIRFISPLYYIFQFFIKINKFIYFLLIIIESIIQKYRLKNFGTQSFNPDLIFLAPLHYPIIMEDSKDFKDPYFGILIQEEINSGKNILLTGPEIGKNYFSLKKINENGNTKLRIFSLRSYIPFNKLIKLIYEGFKATFFPAIPVVEETNLLNGINKLISEDYIYSLENILVSIVYEYCFLELFSINKCNNVIHTFENNTWEKTFLLATKKLNISLNTIGYMHCSILDSHTKLIFTNTDLKIRPMPSKIVCTGLESKIALLEQGEYNKLNLVDGIALRESNLEVIDNSFKSFLNKNKRILILLEGLPTMCDLLEIILDTIEDFNDESFFVRCHPTLPLSDKIFLKIRNHPSYNRLKVSNNKNLLDDIKEAKCVIYKGTTASMYAAYAGLILIRYKDKWWRSDDPLKRSNFFKREFENAKDLNNILHDVSKKSWKNNLNNIISQKKYVKSYLNNNFQDSLRSFEHN